MTARSIEVPIGGVDKFSLIDYPGHPSCVLFTIGCNMRCGYCHNPELVLPERYIEAIPIDDIQAFLQSRRGRLDAVVVTGGEPTMHEDLPELFRMIHDMGYLAKLDSNGTNPDMLEQMIRKKLVDFVAMDIKAPLDDYERVVARPIDTQAIMRSVRLLIDTETPHEFRTTVLAGMHDAEEFASIGQLIDGAQRYAVQAFKADITINPQFDDDWVPSRAMCERIRDLVAPHVQEVVVH